MCYRGRDAASNTQDGDSSVRQTTGLLFYMSGAREGGSERIRMNAKARGHKGNLIDISTQRKVFHLIWTPFKPIILSTTFLRQLWTSEHGIVGSLRPYGPFSNV